MIRFTSLLANVDTERVLYGYPVSVDEAIEYRAESFESYESNYHWSPLSSTPIKQTLTCQYTLQEEDLKNVTRIAEIIYDARYPFYAPESQLTQSCSLEGGILTIPLHNIKGRVQPWPFADRTLVFSAKRAIALDTPSSHTIYGSENATIAVNTGEVIPKALCCPLREAAVGANIQVSSVLYKGDLRLVFDFRVPRDYSLIRSGAPFAVDELPPRVVEADDQDSSPDSDFVGARVRGKRVISPAIRRSQSYTSNYAPAMPDEFILKNVFARTMSVGNNTITLPTDIDGEVITAAFSSPVLEVSYEGGLETSCLYSYERRT